jgi:hypothetical protein
MIGWIPQMTNPFAAALTRFLLEGFISFDDPRESLVGGSGEGSQRDHPPAPDRVFIEAQPPGQLPDRQGLTIVQHISNQVEKQARPMNTRDAGAGSPGESLEA